MGARKPGEWTDKVYRVHISHLYADGNGSYLRVTYGPYTTRRAANAQATQLLKSAATDDRKASAEIEESPLDWRLAL